MPLLGYGVSWIKDLCDRVFKIPGIALLGYRFILDSGLREPWI